MNSNAATVEGIHLKHEEVRTLHASTALNGPLYQYFYICWTLKLTWQSTVYNTVDLEWRLLRARSLCSDWCPFVALFVGCFVSRIT